VHQNLKTNNQKGFSIIEMMIAITVMLIITSAIVSLLKNSLTVATATYELTDAQESFRTAQEYISRDLMNAGDGLKSVTYIPVNTAFVTNFLSLTPVPDASMAAGVTNLGILTTDNNVPGTTVVRPVAPVPVPAPAAVFVRNGNDRQTILQIDPDPTNIQIVATAIDGNAKTLTLPAGTTMSKFQVGEIYFLTTLKGGTFGAITAVNSGAKTLEFANGDYCGLNTEGAAGRIKEIATSGLPAIQRMRIIHYFVESNGLLMRRVFGVKGQAFSDSVIAEHVVGVQFVYSLGLDSNGDPVQPVSVLSTPAQSVAISQVESTVVVETPHSLASASALTGYKQQLSSTTSTSLRNMQFRQALQPKASPTP
jgi:prepilin-type N-terminal cleavage/methylation domain-containing protein